MNNQMLEEILNQYIYFSLNNREELFKILIILLFLLFLVRTNNENKKVNNKRKAKLDKAFNYLNETIIKRNEYKIPEEIERKMRQSCYSRASILMLVASIMKHMGLPNTLPGLAVYNVSGCEPEEPGRCYMYGDGTSSITINLLPEYDIDIVASIVIHECMHHYLNYKRMKFKDKDENEILTDVCAIYNGFGEIIYRGYRERAKLYKRENKIHRLGYLTQSEIKYIMKQL